jgi:hypothetical protein
MMAPRWLDLLRDIDSAKAHFQQAVAAYRSQPLEVLGEYWNRMAFQHAMYSGYTSFEAFLERLLAMLDEPMPVGRDWHAKLLERVATEAPGHRPALISPAFRNAADDLLRFRHVALHSYDRFDPARAAPAVAAAEMFLSAVDGEIAGIKALLDER